MSIRELLQRVAYLFTAHGRKQNTQSNTKSQSKQELKARVAKLEGDLECSYDTTVEALGDALDLKGAETEGHSKRVTAFTIAMARAMGLPGDKIRIIARGAFLHDIGKMAIPDLILRKPGALTREEIAIMQEHCYLGYQMLRKIPFLSEAAEIVYAHQERWDGTGYPRGLKGNEIPLGARLFSIADTLDAIMSEWPYRAAQPFSAAKAEIELWGGRQFDPEVVKIFLTIPESIWHDLRKEIDQQNQQIYHRRIGLARPVITLVIACPCAIDVARRTMQGKHFGRNSHRLAGANLLVLRATSHAHP